MATIAAGSPPTAKEVRTARIDTAASIAATTTTNVDYRYSRVGQCQCVQVQDRPASENVDLQIHALGNGLHVAPALPLEGVLLLG